MKLGFRVNKLIPLLLPLVFMHAQTPSTNGLNRGITARHVLGRPSSEASASSASVVIPSRVLPRILSDSNWETTVVLLNTGSASVTFQQFFFAADGKPATHDEFEAFLEFFDETVRLGKIVAVVGIAHDDPFAERGTDAATQRAAVAFFLHWHYARAEFPGDGRRAVGAAIVGNDDFAPDAGALDSEPRHFDAARERFRLVQAGHKNRQFHGFAHAANLLKGTAIWRVRVFAHLNCAG